MSNLKLLGILGLLLGTASAENVKFQYLAPAGTQSVTLAADFNQWSKSATPLTDEDGNGVWETTLILNEGTYEYRFVVDGEKWVRDPLNPYYGGDHSNSIIHIKHPRQPTLKLLEPKPGTQILSKPFRIMARFVPGENQHPIHLASTLVLLDSTALPFRFDTTTQKIFSTGKEMAEGEHWITIKTRDQVGNVAFPVCVLVNINQHDQPPIAHAGYTQVVSANQLVQLNGGLSFDPDQDPIIEYHWEIISAPAAKPVLDHSNGAFPVFTPLSPGRYVFALKLKAGGLVSQPDTVDVFVIQRQKPVTVFSWQPEANSPKVSSVSLVGEFNNWQPGRDTLRYNPLTQSWQIALDLAPGEYEYKFVINKSQWLPDPVNPLRVADGWSGFNSIIRVTYPQTSIPTPRVSTVSGNQILLNIQENQNLNPGLKFRWFQEIHNPVLFSTVHQWNRRVTIPRIDTTFSFYMIASDSLAAGPVKIVNLTTHDDLPELFDLSQSPQWAQDAIIYEIYVRQFTPEGTLNGVLSKLPYLQSLGINCIWLMPIFESPQEHGYGPTHFFQVDAEYGTNADLKNLVNAAHQMGIRVLLDFIANHTSDQHRYFQSAFLNPQSIFRNWFRWRSDSLLPDGLIYEYHNDWDALPNLNYDNPNVWHFMLDVARYWLEYGIDGYRCDVAWGVPHHFWKTFRREIKQLSPDCLLLNEVLPRAPAYHDYEFDMSYDTDFYGNLLDVLQHKKPVTAIHYGLHKTNINYPATALSLRYLENHDLPRFIKEYGFERTKLAATLLFTIPGTPLLYYGQELGMTEQRAPMPWTESGNDLFPFYQMLISIRQENQALRSTGFIKVDTNQDEVYAYLRGDLERQFLIVLNFSEKAVPCQIKFNPTQFVNLRSKHFFLYNLFTNEKKMLTLTELSALTIFCPAYHSVIYEIQNK